MPVTGYWVIFAAKAPTAFRARRPETLATALKQLQRRHPDAAIRWFDGRRFWASPAQATEAQRAARPAPKRPASWRPGGDHKDPRDKYKLTRDQKRARFKRRLRQRTVAEQAAAGGPTERRRRSTGPRSRRRPPK